MDVCIQLIGQARLSVVDDKRKRLISCELVPNSMAAVYARRWHFIEASEQPSCGVVVKLNSAAPGNCTPDRSKLVGSHGQRPWV
jgi:hypothetical protein